MIKDLFESLDEKVFTAELKESLVSQFNEAVELKAQELAEAKIEEKTIELAEKAEAHQKSLDEKAEEFVTKKMEEMSEAVEKYLDRIVEEFLDESKAKLDESVKSEKADMIIEAMEALCISTGVEMSKILEAKDNSAIEAKLAESIAKNDSLVNENIDLKSENEKLLKAGIIAELKEGLTLVESEKFIKLADIVDFSNDETYVAKLETIKESVKGAKESKEVKEEINESVKEKSNFSFAHLV